MPPTVGGVLRICLDLNVWCATFLGDKAGRSGTASQRLVTAVRRGSSSVGPMQLVISWGMLGRLRKVLETDWGIGREIVDPFLDAIVAIARSGPAGTPPYPVLGGVGVMPLRDAEDAHVLETAIAGQAGILATANFDDFLVPRVRIVMPRLLARHRWPGGEIVIAHPSIVAGWLASGEISGID
jgi:predicted nucleic acid-binding protein